MIRKSSSSAKKSYAGILIDRRFNSIDKQQEAVVYLMNCLRYRVNIALNEQTNPSGANQSQGQSLRAKKPATSQPSIQNRISLYDTLLELLEGFDSSGRAEIFRLLLERRSAIPLFLPNGEHHLPILKLLTKTNGGDQPICIGEDVNLLRLTVISCRQKEDSKTAELLKEVFHLDSFHREDFSREGFTRESMAAETWLHPVSKRDERTSSFDGAELRRRL